MLTMAQYTVNIKLIVDCESVKAPGECDPVKCKNNNNFA